MIFSKPTDLPVSQPFIPGVHLGIDYSDGQSGHPIHAIGDGLVVYNAFEAGGFGNTITVDHGPFKSGYGHMEQPGLVPVGRTVVRGQLLGYVGNTGNSTGPHLHLWTGSNPNDGAFNPDILFTDPPIERQGDDVTYLENETGIYWVMGFGDYVQIPKEVGVGTALNGGTVVPIKTVERIAMGVAAKNQATAFLKSVGLIH